MAQPLVWLDEGQPFRRGSPRRTAVPFPPKRGPSPQPNRRRPSTHEIVMTTVRRRNAETRPWLHVLPLSPTHARTLTVKQVKKRPLFPPRIEKVSSAGPSDSFSQFPILSSIATCVTGPTERERGGWGTTAQRCLPEPASSSSLSCDFSPHIIVIDEAIDARVL